MNKKALWFFITMFCVISAFSQSDSGNGPKPLERLNLSIAGNANIMFGQIVSGYEFGSMDANYMQNRWQDYYAGRIEITSRPVDWYHTSIALQVNSNFPVTIASSIQKDSYRLRFSSILPKAVGVFDLKFPGWSLQIESGLLEYNFNPEIKNFGNYLYRSLAYPFTLETKIDYPYANLMGIRTQGSFLNNQLKAEVIINSITNHVPFYDMSVGLMLSYTTLNKFIDIGGGVLFDRLISVNDSATDLKNVDKGYLIDTTLTYRSTKLDARLTLDFKQLLGNPGFFGKNDLKFYGEAGLIGVKSPHYWPDDTTITPSMLNRVPMLFGFNLPAFKILDLLSVELEYCKSPYPFDWWGAFDGMQTPQPRFIDPADKWAKIYKEDDNLKWTVYLKKSISKFDVIGIFANDHTIYETINSENQPYTEQSLRTSKDWHWYVKLQYNL
jgi:hypothetical protein